MTKELDSIRLKKALRKVQSENPTDPFAASRVLAHLKAGIVTLDELEGEKK